MAHVRVEHIHMEHVRMRDNNSSPHPTENSAPSLIQADLPPQPPNRREPDTECPAGPSPPPSTLNLQYDDKPPPLSKSLFRGFERPSYSHIAILTALCFITYPAFYILTLVAKDKSLFIVRSIVSVWCWGAGFALGYILLKIGAQHLEAATWATVMHMSYEGGDGMKLCDLARSSGDPKSVMSALHLFRSRFGNRGAPKRLRKLHDKRPWSLFLGFFTLLAILGPALTFLFGRIIVIETFVRDQSNVFHEVLIAGDLSSDDVVQATPSGVQVGGSTPDTAEFIYGNDTVYFVQPSLSQFVPGGYGAGSFNPPASVILKDPLNNTLALTGRNPLKGNTGVVLRYPQWGIRIHCEKLPNPEVNLIPESNQSFTYAFVPQDFLRGLFGVYSMDLPTQFTKPDLSKLSVNDTVPSNIDTSTISYVANLWDGGNGEGLGFYSIPYTAGPQEWTTVETVIIRFDTSFTPSGRFPVYLNKSLADSNGVETSIGYDAAVCVQKYEPWIIEAYNTSTGFPSALRMVGKGNDSYPLPPSGSIRGAPIANTRYLNTTGKGTVFSVAHGNSVDRMWRIGFDQGKRWGNYTPPPTAVAFTEGAGLQGYTELSPDRFAIIRARVGAIGALPYLAGSGQVVAQSYEVQTLAFATYEPWQLIGLLVLISILGIMGEGFVPTLPHDIPRREFGVYSWLALFQSQELQFEAAGDLKKFMRLDELEENFSAKRVKFSPLNVGQDAHDHDHDNA